MMIKRNKIGLSMELLKNGLPMAFMHAMTSVGCIFVQSCINGYGVAYTSAYAVCNKYLKFLCCRE
jgi:Na+-driven multidrug efflux pump